MTLSIFIFALGLYFWISNNFFLHEDLTEFKTKKQLEKEIEQLKAEIEKKEALCNLYTQKIRYRTL